MDSINQWLKDNNISEVECLIPDMTGNARGKFVPAAKFFKEEAKRQSENFKAKSIG